MLQVSVGQYSDKGRKAVNQDFHGYLCPPRHLLRTKGIAAAIADGISSSAVSHIAAETAVKSLLTDYYDTSEAWSVKNAVRRVMAATNSWLYAQSRHRPGRFDLDQGYVCTFSAIVLKSRSAHLFHIGDTRICHLVGDQLVHLSEAHRVWEGEKSYLTRALGMREQLEMDYQRYTVEVGAILILMTDGVHEHLPDAEIAQLIRENPNDLDLAAKRIVAAALDRGSDDNLTIQIIRIEQLPPPSRMS
ncbi:PP2C family protein-serine/threonine phosphatase [Hydrogenophilus thermoluteolus]|uniref:PP2C family protein-serine/threonine phosphatase n=1 Tax=Hydrogenophilus thermoluteolus TaxID=297 RepID=UPI003F678A0B